MRDSHGKEPTFREEYASAWERHRSQACTLACHYCVQARKFRDLSWRFIPSDKYAAFTKHERERKANERQEVKGYGNRIIRPKMIQPA